MKRSSALVRKKYIEYLASTMAFSLSIYVAAIVDGILVGKLIGPEAFAAVNLTFPVVCVKNIVFCLLILGGVTLVSQQIGARETEASNRTFTVSLHGGIAFAVLLALIGALTAPWLSGFLAMSGSLRDNVCAYLVPLWALAPFVTLANGSAAFMRLESRHKLAAAIPVLANVINLLCDVVYIRFFHWGIAGAGWATVTGYAAASCLLIPWFRDPKRSLRFERLRVSDLPLLGKVFKAGLPISLIDACDMLRTYTINATMLSLLAESGSQIIAVCNAAMLYPTMAAYGASTAMGTVVGTLYGERDRSGMLHVLKISLMITLGLCTAIFAGLELFPAAFAGIYGIQDAGTLATLVPWLRLYCTAIPLIAPLYILRGFYQSTRQENAATTLSVLEGAVFMIPLFYLLSRISQLAMAPTYAIAVLLSMLTVVAWMQRKAKRTGCENFLMTRKSRINEMWEASAGCTETEAIQASKELLDFCNRNGLPPKISGAISVAAEELCVNISRYAGLKPTDRIDLIFRIWDDSVVLKVRDSGKIFNPTEFVADGRQVTGLSLVRALVTKIEYNQIIGFNTTVVTVKRE